ncbi:hypothetical protein DXG01_011064 [Tephrocybe rancida]|nr:hypothetical protein DXG01_011064 [Tephrocybe rancida]
MAQAISTRTPASHLAQEQKSSSLSSIFKKFVTGTTRAIHVTPVQVVRVDSFPVVSAIPDSLQRGRMVSSKIRRPVLPKQSLCAAYLTGNLPENWSWGMAIDVLERVNENENNAKEAMRALQRDFKYGDPMTQLSAARLWAILLRNSTSPGFIIHSTGSKFTATLEDLISSPHTSPVVRERVLDVIAAAAYASGATALQALWKRVKPFDKPDEGIPMDIDDFMFVLPKKPPPLPTGPTHDISPRESEIYLRDIPTDEDIRHLFQECRIGEGNASLLSLALTLSTEDLETKGVVKEFYSECRSSQEIIVAQIPWASWTAERSRFARDPEALMEAHTEEQRLEETTQEKLLSSLLSANANLLNVLTKYDDMKSAAMESKELENQKVQGEELGMDQRLHPLLHSILPVHASTQSRTPSPMMSPVYEEGKGDSMNPWDARVDSDDRRSPKLVEVPSRVILAELPRYDSSKTSEPAEWLEARHEQLIDCIVQSNRDRTVQKEHTGWISSSLPFPHLAIYMYNTATCDFEALRTAVAVCKDCDILAALCKFREISDGLRRSFNLGPTPTRSDGFDHAVDVIRNIVALDVDVICARLYGVLKDKERYRHLVHLQGDDAQALLDLIQILLDLPSLDRIFRGPFLNTILRLSRRSKLFPGRLWQKRVALEGSEPIAAGKFGDVWKATFCGQAVAVKVLKIYQRSNLEKHIKKVLQETVIWRQLRHVNVLPFLCLHHIDNNERRIGLVSPWMNNGNVKEFLQRNTDVDRISLVTDIAEGLEYLHTMEPKIVHGDLKAVNILISDLHRACLADFGLSSASESQAIRLTSFSSTPRGGTTRWTAPELLKGSENVSNTQTDVYAFACVCYEIFSGDIPFPKLDEYPVMLAVIKGQRPTRPAQCKNWKTPCVDLGLDDKMWALIERCWEADAAHRPSMRVVLQDLPLRKHQVVMGGVEHQRFELSSGGQGEDLISWSGLTNIV